MRAYIVLNKAPNQSKELRRVMVEYLSFDISERVEKVRKRNGDIIMYQDLPMKCEKCNVKDDTVTYHHYYGRRYKHLENDYDNRIALCGEHHTLSSEFSAHLTPKLFEEWSRMKRGELWFERLKLKKQK